MWHPFQRSGLSDIRAKQSDHTDTLLFTIRRVMLDAIGGTPMDRMSMIAQKTRHVLIIWAGKPQQWTHRLCEFTGSMPGTRTRD